MRLARRRTEVGEDVEKKNEEKEEKENEKGEARLEGGKESGSRSSLLEDSVPRRRVIGSLFSF